MFVVQSAAGENKSKIWNKFCSFEALFSKKIGFESSPNTHALDYVAVKRITIAL